MMGPFDNLIASSTALYRIKLITSSGLEKLLLNELCKLSRDCEILSGGACYVEARVDLHNLWRIMLGSRICEQLWMHVCEPFPVRHFRTFMRVLNHAEWRGFIPFSANLPMPYVRVNSRDSLLYHTGMLKKLVHQVIKGHCHKSLQLQGDELPMVLKRRGHLPICPSLMVNIDSDMCEVLANSSGELTERPWASMSTLDARIRPSMVAAIAYQLNLVNHIREGRITTILDPLSHIGTLLFELYSFLQDHCLRAQDHVYPLSNFPLNCKETAAAALSSLKVEGNNELKARLLGTDVFEKYVKDATTTLNKYNKFIKVQSTPTVHHSTDDLNDYNEKSINTTKCAPLGLTENITLTFSSAPLSSSQCDARRTLILTNLYYGDKSRRKEFLEAHRRFETFLLDSPSDLYQNIYVIATENFRKCSQFIWQPELRFNNSGIMVMLLKLCHRKTC